MNSSCSIVISDNNYILYYNTMGVNSALLITIDSSFRARYSDHVIIQVELEQHILGVCSCWGWLRALMGVGML